MNTERQRSGPLSGFADTLLADVPAEGTLYHLVVRIAEVMPLGSGEFISAGDTLRYIAAPDDSMLTILVPLGELDYFSVQQVTDAAAGLMVGAYRSVTFDLSAISFCDSSIGWFLDWVHGFGGENDVKVITSPVIDRVLGLLAGDAE